MKVKHMLGKLLLILGSLFYLLLIAAFAGVIGFILSSSIVILGVIYLADSLTHFIHFDPNILIYLIVTCGILRGVMRYIEQYFNHLLAFKILFNLRLKIFKLLNKLAPTKIDEMPKGKLMSLITADIETLEVFYAHTISPVMISLTITTLTAVFLGLVTNYQYALIVISAHLLIMFYPLLINKKIKTKGEKYREELAKFNEFFLDNIKGLKEISLNNLGGNQLIKINRYSSKLAKNNNQINLEGAYSIGLITFIITFATIAAILLAGFNLKNINHIIIAIPTIMSTFGAVLAVGVLPINLSYTFASAKRVLALYDEKSVVDEITDKEDFVFNDLEVKDLSFKYSEKLILDNINFSITKGNIIGIEGLSGSGKSTIIKQLLRFYPIKENNILYNNTDINNINTKSLYTNIAYLAQDTYLFNDTIKNNLTLYNNKLNEEEINQAINEASLSTYIDKLDQGINTNINQLATNLSAGEKQRIGLARVFLKQANLIILDEATSNIDAINEALILKAILAKKKDHAIIIISHRCSTLSICDHIYKLENKKLIQKR